MACKLCEEKLLEYLYGELDDTERIAMERHLNDSPGCMESYKSFQSIREMTAAEEGAEEVPRELHTRILAHAEEHREKSRTGSFWARYLRPAVTLAVALIIAAVVYLNTSRLQGPESKKLGRIISEKEEPAPKETLVARSFRGHEAFFREDTAGGRPPPAASPERKTLSMAPISGKGTGEDRVSSQTEQLGSALPKETARDRVVASLRREAGTVDQRFARDEESAESDMAVSGMGAAQKAERRGMKLGALGKAAPQAPGVRVTAQKGSGIGTEGQTTASGPTSTEAALGEAKSREQDPLAKAVSLAKAGQCEESLSLMRSYIESNPEETKDSPIWLDLSRCFLEKGRKEPALEMARKASKVSSTAGEAEALIQWIHKLPGVD